MNEGIGDHLRDVGIEEGLVAGLCQLRKLADQLFGQALGLDNVVWLRLVLQLI